MNCTPKVLCLTFGVQFIKNDGSIENNTSHKKSPPEENGSPSGGLFYDCRNVTTR